MQADMHMFRESTQMHQSMVGIRYADDYLILCGLISYNYNHIIRSWTPCLDRMYFSFGYLAALQI
ncbi:hypothetical protein JVU11DRAFT_10258 [Chiua virens]|nr:hypothetical protein JVU11DRAFT_10258 [Chiua virens]